MNELTQLAALVEELKKINERLKRIEENTRPAVVVDGRQPNYAPWERPPENATVLLTREQEEHIRRSMEAAKSYDSFRVDMDEKKPGLMRYPADLDGAHHVAEPK